MMGDENDENDEWTRTRTQTIRNYSTLGIDGFCVPGNDEDLEISGDIKTNPEDFLVREIGYVPPTHSAETAERSTAGRNNNYDRLETLGWIRALAGLQNEGRATDEVCESASKKPRMKIDLEDEAPLRCDVPSPEAGLNSISQQAHTTTDEVKAKNLAEFLFQHEINGVEVTLKELRNLHDSALECVTSSCEKLEKGDYKKVWIDTTKMVRGSNHWRDLHRLIREEYPLVQTETTNVGPDGSSSEEKRWIHANIDATFLPLVPFLVKPCEDLPRIYNFLNDGPITHSESKKKCVAAVSNEDSSHGTIRLRLKIDLPRDQRRAIHKIISKASRSLETTTQNGVHIDPSDSNSPVTSAIVVSWSGNARSSRRRKRKALHAAKEDRLFCVLRKENMEHQLAMKRITRALRCRNSDVGVGGIKDKKAVTFQFCTIKNVSKEKLEHACRHSLRSDLQFSNIRPIDGNFFLSRGHLLGNQFEIIVRRLKRVQKKAGGIPDMHLERMLDVRRSHIDKMVDRIKQRGFVNFFGTQRVGDAGSKDQVGVRPFDIGRAMLRQEWDAAIDLIVQGRARHLYNPCEEEIRARQTWISSGRNVKETLKCFPKNKNAMIKERDILQALLRFRDPLEAIRSMPHGMRCFYIHAYQSLVWNRAASQRIKLGLTNPVKGDLYKASDGEVRLVDDPNEVEMRMIVLPLPGYNVIYPTNSVGDAYKEILGADGITSLTYRGSAPAEATEKGSYRHLIAEPRNLEVESVAGPEVEEDPVVETIRLSFELGSGCYATMLMRELMMTTMSREHNVGT